MGRNRRLSFTAFSVLYAIASGHRYGFDMMEATRLASGTVYPVLSRLERDGLVDSSWEDESRARADRRPARRYYQLTGEGDAALREAVQMLNRIAGDRPAIPVLVEGTP